MVDPSTIPEAQRVYTPPKPPEAANPAMSPTPKPFVNPEDGSTAGKPAPNNFCCTLYANGAIAADCEAFRAFWAKYPKRSNQSVAANQWNRIFADGDDAALAMRASIIMTYLEQQMPVITKDGGQYVPQPSKWLSDRGWIALEDAAKAEAQRRADRQAKEAAAPKLTAEQVAEEAFNRELENTRQRKMSAAFMQENNMNFPLTAEQNARIDAEIEQLRKERTK